MKRSGHLLRLLLLAAALLAATLCGCTAEAEQVVSAETTPTPEPVVISIEMVATPEVPVEALAAPTPTPTPEPTEEPEDFSVLAPTIKMSYEELVGSTDDMKVKAKELLKDGYPDPKTYYIIVDKYWQVTLIYKRIDDGSKFGKPDYDNPVRYMLCSTGNPKKENGYDTTSGIWPIEAPKARFHQFVNMEAAQYLTLIHSLTYFHSILYKTVYDLSTLLPETYTALGNKDSHSCIRLTVPDCRWMFYNIAPGTTCEIRDGSESDTTTGTIRSKLVLPPVKSGVRLRTSEYTWTDNWKIEDVPHEVAYKNQELPKPVVDDGSDPEAAGATPTPAVDGGSSATAAPTVPDAGSVATPVPVANDTPTPAPETPTSAPTQNIQDFLDGATNSNS